MIGEPDREVYFEFTAIGGVVKVAAIDAQTGLEVTVMVLAGAPRADLQRLALRKPRGAPGQGAGRLTLHLAVSPAMPAQNLAHSARCAIGGHPRTNALCPGLSRRSPMSLPDTAAKADRLFTASLDETDPEIAEAVGLELGRQRDEIELIASENIVSRAVLEAQGSVLTNKYAEGLPGNAITAVANTWTSPNGWPSSASPSCSAAPLPMSSRIPAPRPTPPPSWR